MTLKRKLLRLFFLVCGILLIVASPFFIFHLEKGYYPPNVSGIKPPPGQDYDFLAYNIYYTSFGVFLLIAGIVLIVASYYHHEET